jgi:hypothetical protein
MKPFKYKTRRIARAEYPKDGSRRIGAAENFTGSVQGKKASDIEERFARSLNKLQVSFEFQARISSGDNPRLSATKTNQAGELEVDHLIENGGQVIPVQIDGEIGHYFTQQQKLQDEVKTDMVNDFGVSMGWSPVVRVPYTELQTQEESDRVARRIVDGLYVTGYAK